MNPKQHDEVQKLLVELYDLTGYKMTADDPIIAMMLIQRREMAELVAQHQAQQQFFLDELTKKANAIVGSADAFSQQKIWLFRKFCIPTHKCWLKTKTNCLPKLASAFKTNLVKCRWTYFRA